MLRYLDLRTRPAWVNRLIALLAFIFVIVLWRRQPLDGLDLFVFGLACYVIGASMEIAFKKGSSN